MTSSSKIHYKLSKLVGQKFRQYSYPYNCPVIVSVHQLYVIKYYNLIKYLECAVSFDKPLAPGVDKLLQALVGLGISLLIAKRCRRVSSFFNKEFASILNNLGKL